MGTPATSALRSDSATKTPPLSGAGGDAFGSLTGLGGPRKFKKKPVLVLDPEELERAHMMFQEASAELLGEQVERAPKPAAPMLGLAPMDDEEARPDDMGQSDDDQDGGDDEAIPTAEELLQMTSSSRSAEEDAEEQEFAMRALEEGFDEEHRIFPTLPVQQEDDLNAEAAQELAPEERDSSPPEEPTFKLSPMSIGESEPEEDDEPEDSAQFAALSPQIRRETPVRPPEPVVEQETLPAQPDPEPEPEPDPEPVIELPPVEADLWESHLPPLPDDVAPLPGQEQDAQAKAAPEAAPEAEVETAPEAQPEANFEPTPRFEDAPEDLPDSPHIAPFEFQRAARKAASGIPTYEAGTPAPGFSDQTLSPPLPAPHDELPPVEPAAPAPEDVVAEQPAVRDEASGWQEADSASPEPVAAEQDDLVEAEPELQPVAMSDDDFADTGFADEGDAEEPSGNFTEIDDEPVDGYAFMYTQSQRGRALRGAAPGEANSLRARLVREREELLAQIEIEEAAPSLLARFWSWLRAPFS